MSTFRLVGIVTCLALANPASTGDLKKLDRTIAKEPAYETKAPMYGLLIFGTELRTRVWLVLDGDMLYVDRNGNGDLTEEGEKVRGSPTRVAGDPRKTLQYRCSLGKLRGINVVTIGDDYIEVEVMDAARNLNFHASADDQGYLKFAERPQDAPVINCGPLTLLPRHKLFPAPTARDWEYLRVLRPDQVPGWATLYVTIGTLGLGAGTTTAIKVAGVPKDKHPIADVEFPSPKAGKPIRERTVLDHRC